MTRIIIDNDVTISDAAAAWYVSQVMNAGRISTANGIDHYCWVTRFADGVSVITKRKRSLSAADSFVVRRIRT